MHEHFETILEADATHTNMTDPASMLTNMNPDHPVLPGAATFYQDHDVWDSELTIGQGEFELS